MAESNLKEMMIDDINEEADEEIQSIENQPKLKWYLIDTERTFCKVWNFIITLLTIYSLFVVPYMLVFPDVYEPCFFKDEKTGKFTKDSSSSVPKWGRSNSINKDTKKPWTTAEREKWLETNQECRTDPTL
jgi:hypothetical protein